MNMRSERKYLLKRSAQERELAWAATDSRAARVHFSMALEYERRLVYESDRISGGREFRKSRPTDSINR
jgi:hypothetical protein